MEGTHVNATMSTKNELVEQHTDSNVNPNIWGPDVWATMHRLALKSDIDKNPKAFSAFLGTLTELLPCAVCRTDYTTYLKAYGAPEIGAAFQWTFDLHNWVNRKLGKPTMDLSKAKTLWSRGSCANGCTEVTKDSVGAQQFDVNGVPIKIEGPSNVFTVSLVLVSTILVLLILFGLLKGLKLFLV
jgi:hypothetical protein